MSRLLEPNTSVQDLNLRGNAMGADGVAALQAMCRHNATLEILCGLQIRKFVQYADLQELDMSAMGLGDAELSILVALLRSKDSLTDLDLRMNAMSNKSAQSIFRSYKTLTAHRLE